MGVVGDLFGAEKCFTTGSKICGSNEKNRGLSSTFH